VQLSAPRDYQGCDLLVPHLGGQGSREQGSLTIFPSIHIHTVTPVYAGLRHAVVGWVHGPTMS
jgi:PKHD-type hydroxylase